MLVKRYDRAGISNTIITAEGFIRTDAVVTRSGVFIYRNADGSTRRELRHPDHVFKQDSLDSMKMIPVTMLHPKEGSVTAENAKALKVGFTGENVRVDGRNIRVSVVVTDSDAVQKVKGGTQELSLGYTVELERQDGKWDGQDYDHVQKNVTYNHLAIVPSARAGREARIVLDGEDAEMVDAGETKIEKQTHKSTGGIRMIKVNIDGLEYETAPEVAKALEKAQAHADELTGQVKTLTADVSKVQAAHDVLKEKLDAEEKVDKAAAIATAVSARLALVSNATPHLDEETLKKVNDMSDAEIKTAVILAHFPEAKLDGKDATYLEARYDAAIELKVDKAAEQNMAQQRQAVNADGTKGEKRVDAKASRDAFVAGLTNEWKTENK